MKFNFVRLHQSVGMKVGKGMYLGLGYKFDGYFNIRDEKLRLDPGDTLITSHYAYSKNFGFDSSAYFSAAINATFIVDKRDNMIQAYKGYFLKLDAKGAFKFLGSSKNGSMFDVEWRSFHGLSKRNPAHLFAFWLLGEFTPEGQSPYLILPATAFDQRGRSARGYTQGRFRGNGYVYGEAEYRFPISPCGGVLSGVVFMNATTASNPAQDLGIFESVKPGYGFGLRVMLDKQSRSNLALDWGYGQRSFGFYLAVSETF
jgi:outer membrane protein assembly factor BamA